MKILVTGAAGFIGYHLCKRLLSEGHAVVGLDNINDYYDPQLKFDRLKELGVVKEQAEKWNTLSTSIVEDNFSFIRLNLQDRAALPKLFSSNSFDQVCNLAAQAGVRYSIENPEVYVDTNIVGFLNILECCRDYKVSKLVVVVGFVIIIENPFQNDLFISSIIFHFFVGILKFFH